jgi:methylase of polypeptide subunit release factors
MQKLRDGRALVYTDTGPGGTYRNALQLLHAVKRRYRRKMENDVEEGDERCKSITQQWMLQRQLQREQSDMINRILVQVCFRDKRPCKILGLRGIPTNAKTVLAFAFQHDHDFGQSQVNDQQPSSNFNPNYILLSLNDFLAMVGAYEWNRKGVYVNALQSRIYPHFGVFPPTRQDYITLLKGIKIDNTEKCISMLEVGIGSGILSAILLKQNKVQSVVGTDINPYAIACAQDNFQRLGLDEKVDLYQTDLFPISNSTTKDNKYDIILFNPPWLPGNPVSELDRAVYDTCDQNILRRFLTEVQHYIAPGGRVFLMLSNLGILLGLFQDTDLNIAFHDGSLEIIEVNKTTCKAKLEGLSRRNIIQPINSVKAARANEVISLYQLRLHR